MYQCINLQMETLCTAHLNVHTCECVHDLLEKKTQKGPCLLRTKQTSSPMIARLILSMWFTGQGFRSRSWALAKLAIFLSLPLIIHEPGEEGKSNQQGTHSPLSRGPKSKARIDTCPAVSILVQCKRNYTFKHTSRKPSQSSSLYRAYYLMRLWTGPSAIGRSTWRLVGWGSLRNEREKKKDFMLSPT